METASRVSQGTLVCDRLREISGVFRPEVQSGNSLPLTGWTVKHGNLYSSRMPGNTTKKYINLCSSVPSIDLPQAYIKINTGLQVCTSCALLGQHTDQAKGVEDAPEQHMGNITLCKVPVLDITSKYCQEWWGFLHRLQRGISQSSHFSANKKDVHLFELLSAGPTQKEVQSDTKLPGEKQRTQAYPLMTSYACGQTEG